MGWGPAGREGTSVETDKFPLTRVLGFQTLPAPTDLHPAGVTPGPCPGLRRSLKPQLPLALVGGAEIPLSTTKCSHHLKIQSCVILFGGNVRTSSWGGSVSGSVKEAREGVGL